MYILAVRMYAWFVLCYSTYIINYTQLTSPVGLSITATAEVMMHLSEVPYGL